MTTFEDYTKIIEELQSHRREIEKLQTDFASPTSDEKHGGGADGGGRPVAPLPVLYGTLTAAAANPAAKVKSTRTPRKGLVFRSEIEIAAFVLLNLLYNLVIFSRLP